MVLEGGEADLTGPFGTGGSGCTAKGEGPLANGTPGGGGSRDLRNGCSTPPAATPCPPTHPRGLLEIATTKSAPRTLCPCPSHHHIPLQLPHISATPPPSRAPDCAVAVGICPGRSSTHTRSWGFCGTGAGSSVAPPPPQAVRPSWALAKEPPEPQVLATWD